MIRKYSNLNRVYEILLGSSSVNSHKSFIFIFVGSLITTIIYGIDVSINFEGIRIRPIHIIIWLIWLTGVESLFLINSKSKNSLINISTGASLGVIIGYMLSGGSFLAPRSILPYILLAGLCLALLYLIKYGNNSVDSQVVKKATKFSFTYWPVLAVLIVLVMRLGNISTMNIPNEDRSLMISGIEVHHFISGMFIVMLSQIALYHIQFKNGKKYFIAFLNFLVIGLAMIADQLTYIVLYPLTDDAYFTMLSLVGPFIGTSWIVTRIYIYNKHVV